MLSTDAAAVTRGGRQRELEQAVRTGWMEAHRPQGNHGSPTGGTANKDSKKQGMPTTAADNPDEGLVYNVERHVSVVAHGHMPETVGKNALRKERRHF